MCIDPISMLAGGAIGGLFGKKKPAPQPAATTAAPTKTSADTQAEAEQERLRRAFSTQGFASTIMPAGFGGSVKDPTVSKSVTFGR